MHATNLKKTGAYARTTLAGPVTRQPGSLSLLRKLVDPATATPLPLRVHGAGSAATDCNRASTGTILKTTGLDRIIRIDPDRQTVTAQAGVRLGSLVAALAEEGLELVGGYDLEGRTVGGAIASPCFGPSIGSSGCYFSSHVVSLKVLKPNGEPLHVDAGQKNLLGAMRMSFGMLGLIYEATMRVRPIRTFTATHRRVTIDKFASLVDALANGDVGFKFYLMPYRDRVYIDLRRYESQPGNSYGAPWKLKDWGESTVLPNIFKSLNRVVPIPSVKYRLIDGISEATQGIVNSKLVSTGTFATAQSSQRRSPRRCHYSTWCFPAANFSMVARAYRDFCVETYERTRYRCDMPAVGYRLCKDQRSILSPSYDEAMIALTAASTQRRGWDDFVIDLAEFAEKWSGLPLISASRAARAEHVIQAYNRRLDFFRRLRRQMDPEDRLLSPFLAQFFM
jgi:FAD/FMN-containing dehydrogenase